MDCLFLRLMLHIYTNQRCVVKWNGSTSDQFSVSNGVRQGTISSAELFSVYIDDLIKILTKSRLGCAIDGFYYGVFIYADDILLLSASRMGLQVMVKLCEKFTAKRNLKFGTNPKTLLSQKQNVSYSPIDSGTVRILFQSD